jgi:D-alanine-D-alanine ligase
LSNTEEPLTADKFLNFDDKYKKNSGGFETIKRVMPASITVDQNNDIVSTVSRVYTVLKMSGVVRFDFIISNDNIIYLNEVNTIPGSMANYLFDKQKYPYSKLIEVWISNAVYKSEQDGKIIRTLDTDVLNNGFDGFKK